MFKELFVVLKAKFSDLFRGLKEVVGVTQGATMVSQDYLVMFANATFSIGSVLTEEGDFLLLESGDEILL